ncbi:MAG: cupin domain-containing protein [Candidatus Sumerlaeaceae bacterium]|nr:cupin domain-containing protein [Candidatus Sumerlaeaceae bacterium]
MPGTHVVIHDGKGKPVVTLGSIVTSPVVQATGLKAVRFVFDAGQELSEHTAAVPAVMHFLSGRARVGLGGETVEATAGTMIYMEPNLPHSIFAETPVHMVLLMLKQWGGDGAQ